MEPDGESGRAFSACSLSRGASRLVRAFFLSTCMPTSMNGTSRTSRYSMSLIFAGALSKLEKGKTDSVEKPKVLLADKLRMRPDAAVHPPVDRPQVVDLQRSARSSVSDGAPGARNAL